MRVAVYLGSHEGKKPVYCETAFELGRRLAREGYGVVYGGASVGTMGALAKGVISEKGECIGIYPNGFMGSPRIAQKRLEIRQDGLSNMIYVKDFAERKKLMEEMSDCCVALPGSWGTMDELFAYAISSQLGFNGGKPLFILNVDGYYEYLKCLIGKMVEEGFVDEINSNLIVFCDNVDEFIEKLKKV